MMPPALSNQLEDLQLGIFLIICVIFENVIA